MANGPSINKLVESVTDSAGKVVSSTIASIVKAIRSPKAKVAASTTQYSTPRPQKTGPSGGTRRKAGTKRKKL